LIFAVFPEIHVWLAGNLTVGQNPGIGEGYSDHDSIVGYRYILPSYVNIKIKP